MYLIELPAPPSTNSLYRSVNGRTILSKKGRDYKREVVLLLSKYGLANKKLEDKFIVRVEYFPCDNRERDTDNYTKVLFDSLTKARFWLDDKQVKEHSVRIMPKADTAKVAVYVMQDMQDSFF